MARVTRPDGELIVATGATRSGKTTFAVQLVRADRRLLLWDAADEGARYDCEVIRSVAELRDRVQAPPKLERLAYVPSDPPRQFDFFCRMAWAWIRVARSTLVVEELADVTSPGKAPPAWGKIIRTGLRYGARIVAITQRPSESDKTALGNATRVRCHRVMFPRDRLYIAQLLGVELSEVERLPPGAWIERDAFGRLTRGGASRARLLRESL